MDNNRQMGIQISNSQTYRKNHRFVDHFHILSKDLDKEALINAYEIHGKYKEAIHLIERRYETAKVKKFTTKMDIEGEKDWGQLTKKELVRTLKFYKKLNQNYKYVKIKEVFEDL